MKPEQSKPDGDAPPDTYLHPTKLLMYFAKPPDLSPLLTFEEVEGLGVGVAFFVEEALVVVMVLNTYQPLSDLYQPLLVLATTLMAVPALSVVTFEYVMPGPLRATMDVAA